MLVKALEEMCGQKLSKRAWKKKKYVCTVTHDIETKNGLQRARRLKKLEERYGVPSAWYIPSKHYILDAEMVRELANHGEIGAHDTKHDGKLVYLPKDRLIKRFVEAKKTLAEIAGQNVVGFRAPLLQHNLTIIQALTDAGYVYDTSIPTWEPNHPCTMKPHGIGTVFPFRLGGLVEVPVTLTQDHQLLTFFGMSPRQVAAEWWDMTHLIRSLGGLATFLVHPDYELGDSGSVVYEEILSNISTDNEAWIALPSEVAEATCLDKMVL
jgi:peptidoglycan/xylan/chitin deacetylase (PgdA/CDA1 family)